jgi:hypothetical protein
VGVCGSSPDETCWCDAVCGDFGDCCADFVAACPAEANKPAGNGCTPQNCNTQDATNDANGACYCDAACADYGDCCDNKQQVCG